MAAEKFPLRVKVGNAVVKIYRVPHAGSAGGWIYTVSWKDPETRVWKTRQRSDLDDAKTEAKTLATMLNAGQHDGAPLRRADVEELHAARRVCGATPLLTALQEWKTASQLTGGNIIPAAKAWSAKAEFTPIDTAEAVDKFIAEKNAAGNRGEKTYRSKLKPIPAFFPGRELHSIRTPEWTSYLARWPDPNNRDEFRKRARELCRWAQKNRYIPRGEDLEISLTAEPVKTPPKIGIISPEDWGRALWYIAKYHTHHLAALVLSGFCGMRSSEVHGKNRDKPEERQLWSDVHISAGDEHYVHVSYTKTNTPMWRDVPLCAAAVDWLNEILPTEHGDKLHVCDFAAMERVREILISAGLVLPENCFRHSYISYEIERTGDKARVATNAGTSIQMIERHYRRPLAPGLGNSWFSMTVDRAMKLPELEPKTREEISRLGGMSVSPAKLAAVTKNLGSRDSEG